MPQKKTHIELTIPTMFPYITLFLKTHEANQNGFKHEKVFGTL